MFAHRYFERAEARSLALVICCRVSPVEVSKSFLFRGKSVGVPDGHPFFRIKLSKRFLLDRPVRITYWASGSTLQVPSSASLVWSSQKISQWCIINWRRICTGFTSCALKNKVTSSGKIRFFRFERYFRSCQTLLYVWKLLSPLKRHLPLLVCRMVRMPYLN